MMTKLLLYAIISGNWSEPSLLVASSNLLHRVLPGAVGTAAHEVLETNSAHNITALAFDFSTQTVFFAESAVANRAHFFIISSFSLEESNNV